MVSDLDDGQHGEINVFEDPAQATRLIESLLESGFEQERIRVFNGAEMEMQVSHRPVVALVGGDEEAEAPAGTKQTRQEQPGQQDDDFVAARATTAKVETREEVAATPFVKDGVRFSSLFKPA
jgi:hypothetical protein